MCSSLLPFLFILLCRSIAAIPLSFIEDAKYEGTTCVLEDGLDGDCKKLVECPSRIEEVKHGLRESKSTGRCGFDGFEEIVCCPRSTLRLEQPDGPYAALYTPCTMKSGRAGTCQMLQNCPYAIRELEELIVNETTMETCGPASHSQPKGVETIVCCIEDATNEVAARSAGLKCNRYDAAGDNNVADPNEVNSNKADFNGGSIYEVSTTRYYNENDTFTIPDNTPSKLSFNKASPYVFNGQYSIPGQFPHMAALGYKDENADNNSSSIEYNCGGSLISLEYVVTAAHCVSNVQDKVPVEVLLGTTFISSQAVGVQKIPISNIITHPKYRRSQYYNDIAILKLKTGARVTDTVKPICLDTKPLRPLYRSWIQISAAGWGATDYDNERSSLLMWTDNFRFVDGETCQKFFVNVAKLSHGIDDNLLCVTSSTTVNRSDTCRGDSGGPLIATSTYSNTLIGITSFGISCGTSAPGVYTAVYPYLDWIEEHVWPKSAA